MKVLNFILILASLISLIMGKPCFDLFSDLLSTNPLEHGSGLSPPSQTVSKILNYSNEKGRFIMTT